MTGKKILVTGAGGFIGHAVATHLAEQGHRVTGTDLHFPHRTGEMRFDPQVADIREKERMAVLMRGVEVVFHLASAHLATNLDESEYWSVNVHSLPLLLEQAHLQDVSKFVHVSSVGVYGNLTTWPANEDTACNPQSIYGVTKLEGETRVKEFVARTSFPVMIIRPAWVYGSACPRTRKLYRSLRKGTFVMIGRGQNLRHPLYVTDLIEAFEQLMAKDADPGEVFVIGGQRALTTHELVQEFRDALELDRRVVRLPYWVGAAVAGAVETGFSLINREPPISRRTLEFFNTNNAFDVSKAKRELGFAPRFSFAEGLADCRHALEATA